MVSASLTSHDVGFAKEMNFLTQEFRVTLSDIGGALVSVRPEDKGQSETELQRDFVALVTKWAADRRKPGAPYELADGRGTNDLVAVARDQSKRVRKRAEELITVHQARKIVKRVTTQYLIQCCKCDKHFYAWTSADVLCETCETRFLDSD